jgi:hypothetical protein
MRAIIAASSDPEANIAAPVPVAHLGMKRGTADAPARFPDTTASGG